MRWWRPMSGSSTCRCACNNEVPSSLGPLCCQTLTVSDRPSLFQITGSILCNCKVSGMPDLTITLNRVQDEFDNVALHHCVRLLRYEKDGVLSFVPPDGAFTLMKYVVRKKVR